MQTYNLVFMGFGRVGQALARLLMRKEGELRQRYGVDWRVTAIFTGRHGRALNPAGLPLAEALRHMEEGKTLDNLSTCAVPQELREALDLAQGDVFFEITPSNAHNGEPALTHLRLALESGLHAITANKGPLVYGYRTLRELAKQKQRRFLFEATVLDGAPVFSLFREALPTAHLLRFQGILNSTTNFILTEMEAGRSFEEAISAAQAIGIAETDSSLDVDGWDAAVKVAVLVTVLMDYPLLPNQMEREGIRRLTAEQVRAARADSHPFKLVCRAEKDMEQVRASVRPEQVPLSDPLASVSGTSSLVHFETDTLTGLTITEHNPGLATTAYGLLADFLTVVRCPDQRSSHKPEMGG
jgi:homoserine dehydrogenase